MMKYGLRVVDMSEVDSGVWAAPLVLEELLHWLCLLRVQWTQTFIHPGLIGL